MKSLYKEENVQYFKNMTEESQYFIKKYVIDLEDPISSLEHNSEIASLVGKIEIASIWKTLSSLYAAMIQKVSSEENLRDSESITADKDNKISLSSKQRDQQQQSSFIKKNKKPENIEFENSINNPNTMKAKVLGMHNVLNNEIYSEKIFRFYSENKDILNSDLSEGRITITNKNIMVNKKYDEELLEKVSAFYNGEGDSNKLKSQHNMHEHFSTVVNKVLQELMDNGEFLHAFKMYSCLQNCIEVSNEVLKLWEFTFVEHLASLGLYVQAIFIVKNSKIPEINAMNVKGTFLETKCGKCYRILQAWEEGECSRCKVAMQCSVCNKPVKGLVIWCQICGHGGHMNEINEWFSGGKDRSCPTMCGHKCFIFP